MKRLILITLLMATAAYAATEPGFVNWQNISKYTVSAASKATNAKGISGKVSLTSNATSCSVFLNATTLARTQAATGYPLVANAAYSLNLPQVTNLTFTCATSAGNRAVYIVR